MGGGARNRGLGGDGSLFGEGGGVSFLAGDGGGSTARLGGGGGGAPRRPELPVCCGLIDGVLAAGGGADGGGGGGAFALRGGSSALFCSSACLCSMYDLIKSEFSAICSSVIPIFSSSSNKPLHDGSTVSRGEGFRSELGERSGAFAGSSAAGGPAIAGLGGMMD
ncbi:hypothetical protein VTO42DRAFT_4813 [Malbranchea cinnamomea]